MVLGGALGPGFGAWGAAPLCVAGVAQLHIHLRSTWQAWHKLTCTVVLRGRRATYGTGWRAWARIWRLGRRAILRGRRGTTSHPPSFHVAGVAQTHMYRRFVWQACHLWYWVAQTGAHCVAGVAQPFRFTWQASTQSSASSSSRPLSHPHSLLSTHSLSTHSLSRTLCPHTLCPHTLCPHTLWRLSIHTLSTHSLSTHSFSTCPHTLCPHTLCGTLFVHTLFVTHSLSTSHTLCPHTLCPHTLCRSTHSLSTWQHTLCQHTLCQHTLCPPSFHVAGVEQTHMYRRFVWQACHLWYWVARLGPDLAPGAPRHFAWPWRNLTSTFVSRGRCGTN